MFPPSKLNCVLRLLTFSQRSPSAGKLSAARIALHFGVILLAVYLYKLSLAPCPRNSNVKCVSWLFDENGLSYICFVLLLSGGIFVYLAIGTILGIIPKAFYLIFTVPSLIFVYNLGWKTSWKEHGGLNRLALFAIQFIALILWFIWKIFDWLSKKCAVKYKLSSLRIQLLTVFIVLIFLLYYVNVRKNIAVKNFYDYPRLNVELKHEQDSSLCTWTKPRYNILDVTSDFLNFASLSGCGGAYSTEWIPEALKSVDVIGFPAISNLSSRLLSNMPALWSYICDHFRNCSDIKDCPNVEQFLDVGKKPKFSVRVAKNKTKLRKRLAISEASKTNNLKKPDVLILFIDALSRPAFRRQLPKTSALLKKWVRDNGLNVASFVKLSSFAAFTEPNLFPLMFGVDRETAEYRSQRANNLLRLEGLLETIASQSGYMSGFAHTSCLAADFEWKSYLPLEMPRYDHTLIFCDPNFINVNDPFSLLKGPFSVFKRCLYGRQVHEYVFDYITSFWEVYSDVPKVFSAHFSEAHESTGEVIANMDNHLVSFLSELKSSGALNNTALFLLSDHGNHMHPALRLFPNAGWSQEEVHDPLLISITPSHIGNIDAIAHNQDQLVTMYDVRKTILSLTGCSDPITDQSNQDNGWLERRRKKQLFDVFNERINSERNCQTAGVLPATCMCAKTTN